ncbi:Fc fragment of IgM receptor [Rhinolophus ferrumequinum]|uniref:Fc of IgM receptor n=1 Tax=Rhinolophus ferrumequinum TaxID=59479 RepID=A0A7J7SWS6_RHIFE|nr:Fc fragment of IgM receptor [Rhinolophus ferrumequinum]
MDIWLWSLYFLPVSGALKILPEVKLEGMLGGSITIKCPLPETPRRLYLCREIDKPRSCVTVISNTNFVRMDYKDRVTLKPCPDQNLFLVESMSHSGKRSLCLSLQHGFRNSYTGRCHGSRCLHMPVPLNSYPKVSSPKLV